MSGHSKWANIKRRKGAQDQKRGKLFAKLIKEIMVATKMGGGDPDMNARLRLAVDKAKAQSVPRDTIERAIAKASGDLDADTYEEITYEGYGPGGVGVLVECLTDNRNRTAADVRHAFAKHGGNMGQTGSVSYMFSKKGVFRLDREDLDEETVMMAALDGGGEDIEDDGEAWVVTCAFEDYDACQKALEGLGVEVSSSVEQVADNEVPVAADQARSLLGLLDWLDDLDDVQDTYTNADIDEEILEEAS